MISGATWQFSEVGQRAAESPWGRALRAYYGEKGAWGKIWALVSLGEPLYADMYRIAKTPEFKAKAFEGIRFEEDARTGQRAPYAADVPRYLKQWQRAMREEIAKNPRRGEQLAAKESWFKRLATDLAFSPMMYVRAVPARLAVEVAVPKVARVVGRPVIGAIAKRPTAARWLLSPGKRIEELGDEGLMHLWYRLRGAVGAGGAVKRASAQEVRKALGRFSVREVEEAALIAQQTENRAAYSLAVRSGKMKAASSNRVEECAEEIRRLTREAFARIPRRTALPGSAEETAAVARVKAAGGVAKAGKIRLKRGEFRLREELREVRKAGKLIGLVDEASGEWYTAYRKAYYPLPSVVKAGPPPAAAGAGVPGGRRPRVVARGVVPRTAREVEEDLARMIAAEPRYRVLVGIEADLGMAMARSKMLADPAQRAAALEVFADLERRLGKPARGIILRGLQLLDRWGVTTPKQLYTLYNPAWYFKNYIDTVGVKSLLAGVPPAKLHKFLRVAPKDVYGNAVEVGVTWTMELTGMDPRHGGLQAVGNAIENCGRRAVWDDVYWKTLRSLRGGGMATARAHERASNAAMKMVAKVHFDYGDLSRLDEVMRRIIPFWVYEMNQLRWMAEQAVMRPRLMYGGYKFFEVGEKGGGPAVRVPGVPTLQVQPFGGLSPVRYIKTISGILADDERERERWQKAGPLGRWVQRGEKWGFYAHPFLEQGLSAILKGGDLMDDRSWKQVAPLVGAVGKMLKVDMTYIGVWRTMFPGEESAPRIEQLKRGYKGRVMQRHAFSILDGEEWGVARCEKYVEREMQVAGVGAFFGLYPQVRERKYEEMQRLLRERRGLSYAERQEFDRAHPEVGLFLASLTIRQR